MIRNRNVLTVSSFAAMFFLGVGTAIIGAAARSIGLSPFQIGLLISVQNMGFVFSVVVAGTLADSTDKARLMAAASLVLTVSFFLFYLKDSFILNLLVMLIIGVGIGGYEGAADAMLLDIHERRENLFISVNHFFVTLGGLMITIYTIFLQANWRKGMVQSSLAALALTILFGASQVSPRKAVTHGLRSRIAFLGKQRPVLMLFLMACCAVGIELTLMGMITTWLMELHGFSQVSSNFGLVAFLSGVALGRLVLGFFVAKGQMLKYILTLFALNAVILSSLIFASPGTIMTYFLLVVSGATVSVIFPLIISLSGLKYPGLSGMAMGVIKLGIPVGGIVVPFLLSVLTQAVSFRVSLLLLPVIGIIGFILALSNRELLAIAPHPG
jgi:fucose permease